MRGFERAIAISMRPSVVVGNPPPATLVHVAPASVDFQSADPAPPLDPKTTTMKPFQGELYVGYVVAKDEIGTHVVQQTGYHVYVTDVAQVALVNTQQPKAKAKGK